MEFRNIDNNMRTRRNSMRRGYTTYSAPGVTFTNRDKKELESLFPDDLLLETLKNMENPLQKNLGDAYYMDRSAEHLFQSDIHTHVGLKPEKLVHTEIPLPKQSRNAAWRPEILPTLSGIANMISGLISTVTEVITLHYNRPATSDKNMSVDKSVLNTKPVHINQAMDFGEGDEVDASPPIDDSIWHFLPYDCAKNTLCENSGNLAQCSPRGGVAQAPPTTAMSLPTLQNPADTCQAKMAKIQDLLSGKIAPKPKVRPYNRYKSKKVFIDPKFVQEKTVEVFVPEPVECLQSMVTTNFVNPGVIIQSHLTPAETLPRVRLESQPTDKINQTKNSNIESACTQCYEVKSDLELIKPASVMHSTVMPDKVKSQFTEIKSAKAHEIDNESGCNEKWQNANDKPTHGTLSCTLDTVEILANNVPQKQELVSSCEDKLTQLKALLSEQKNNRLQSTSTLELDSTPDTKEEVKMHVKAVTNCAVPVPKYRQALFDSDLPSSFENSPVITVTPPDCFNEIQGRFESTSSDDSFVIVFSESPNPSPPGSPRDRLQSLSSEDSFIVFQDDKPTCFTVHSGDSDCESNLASASRYSRTVADLTDESLYLEDGDCHYSEHSDESDSEDENTVEIVEEKSKGVLLTEEKKLARVNQPEKRVSFSASPPRVHRMCVWSYAARQARIGNWRQAAADAERFKLRIADADAAISWVLKPAHRNRVKFQRFMPWWHAERRREQAERKAEEEKKIKEEAARLAEEKRLEEERLAEEARLEEERIAEEKRIEEEVREEMERERKSRKTVSCDQFAMNLRVYLNNQKLRRASSPQIRTVPELSRRKLPRQQTSDGSGASTVNKSICPNARVGNAVNGYGEDADRSSVSNVSCDTVNVDLPNGADIFKNATDIVSVTRDTNATITETDAAEVEAPNKNKMENAVSAIDQSDTIKRVYDLTNTVRQEGSQ